MASVKESPVHSLVAAITKHKDFRSLCGYSVKSLATVVSPPLNGWEVNAVVALSSGAVAALAYVIGKHASSATIVDEGCKVNPSSMRTVLACAWWQRGGGGDGAVVWR